MGFLKKITGQEPLMKTILGTFNLMTTNLESDLSKLTLKDVSAIAQIQIILHKLNESAFRLELKTLEKSTILEGMAFPEISGIFTNYKLTDFKGSGEYFLQLSSNDLRIHSYSKDTTLRYVNLNLSELGKKQEKLENFRNRKSLKKHEYIFGRTKSKKLIGLENELINWLKSHSHGWNLYGDIYDNLTKYVKFEFEIDWYNEFTEKYGNNIIEYILKGHSEKIKHISQNEIDTFLHLQEKFATARKMEFCQDANGKNLYNLIAEIRKKEIEECFNSLIIQNKELIDFSISYDKFKEDEFELIDEIEDINEDDGLIAYEIVNNLDDLLKLFYQNSDLTLNDLKEKFYYEFKKSKEKAMELENENGREKLIEHLTKNENWIKQYVE